jgi:predicted ester cyclase
MPTTSSGPEFQGIAATGKKIVVGQIVIFRVADGKIAEYWEQADFLGMMQQLGAVPGG